MSLFYITVPTKAYEVELRIKELGHPEIYVENGDLTNLNERFLFDENDGRIAKEPETFVLRCPHAPTKVWDVIVAEDYMIVHSRQAAMEPHDFDQKIKADIHRYFLEKHLTDTLERFDIEDAMPSNSHDYRFAQAVFCVPATETDEIISRFQFVGIGSNYGSTITVCKANIYYGHTPGDEDITEPVEEGEEGKERSEEKNKTKNSTHSTWTDFVKSIKSRLTVAQVVTEIRTNAVLTFDFVMFSLISAILAVLGLLEDSTVIMVGAMLISPMRGPLMAFTFGTVIHDVNLIVIGVRSEIVGLCVCVITGYISGLLTGVEFIQGPWHGVGKWPTYAMIARGQLRDLILGACYAVPAGIGLALSILSGNTGSLVGVALAAALMIPAVNSGLMWGIGTITFLKEGFRRKTWFTACTFSNKTQSRNIYNDYVKDYNVQYCDNMVREFLALGGVSFSMALLTIVIIYLVAILILKIKEVAPYTTRKSLRRFWKEDLAVARNYNAKKSEVDDLHSTLLREIDNSDKIVDEIGRGLDQDYVFRQINRRMGGSGGRAAIEELKMHYENNKAKNDGSNNNRTSRSNQRVPSKAVSTFTAPFSLNHHGDGQTIIVTQSALTQQGPGQSWVPRGQKHYFMQKIPGPGSLGSSHAQPVELQPTKSLDDRFPKTNSNHQANNQQNWQNFSQRRPTLFQHTEIDAVFPSTPILFVPQYRNQWHSHSLPTLGTQPKVTAPRRKRNNDENE